MINSHLQFHTQLLNELAAYIDATPPFSTETLTEDDKNFYALLQRLTSDDSHPDEFMTDGQSLLSSIVMKYPQITPRVPRDLFWYFGGDCLHYLEDSEISAFQQLDENYHTSLTDDKDSNYQNLREAMIGTDYFTPYLGHPTH